jgi:uncharacterized membrane protein
MFRTDANIFINRPVEEVWNYFVNTENAPNWALGLKEAHNLTEGPTQLGTRCAWTQTFLGKSVDSTQEVIEFEPYKLITFKSVSGPFPIMYRYTFEPTAEGTKLTTFLEGEPGAFFKLAGPVLTIAGQRQMQHSLENLKDLVEAEALVPA